MGKSPYTREQWVQRIISSLRSDLEFVDDGREIKNHGYVQVRCRICEFIGEQSVRNIAHGQKKQLSTCDCRRKEREKSDRQVRELATKHRWLTPVFEDRFYSFSDKCKIKMRCRECGIKCEVQCCNLKYNRKPSFCLCREQELAKENRERIEQIHKLGCLVESSMTKEISSWNTCSIRKFKCIDCGDIFSSRIADVLEGSKGCLCRSNGFTRTSYTESTKYTESRVYMIHLFIEGEEFVKIGIARASVKQRFGGYRDMPYNYETLREVVQKPGDGAKTFDLEKKLHRAFEAKFGKHSPQIWFGGGTECFNLTNIEETKSFFDQIVAE